MLKNTFFALFLIIPSLCSGATIYVDNGVSDCSDYDPVTRVCGGGFDQAYNTFANAFNIEDFSPGDILYARSGIYTEGIIFGSNDEGDSSQQFVVSAYGGESVTIDVTGYCIDTKTRGVEYVTIEGFTCELNDSTSYYGANLGGGGSVYDSIPNTTGIIIKSNTFLNGLNPSINFNACQYCVADNNIIQTKDGNFSNQSDGISFYRGANNIASNNYITIRNDNNVEHVDCIQSAWDDNFTVFNNYCEQDNLATSNRQFYIIEASDGWVKVFNNIMYKANGTTNTNALLIFDGTADTYVYNNTMNISGAVAGINHRNSGALYIQNNIFNLGNSSAPIYLQGGTQTKTNIHHNLVNSTISGGNFYRDNTGFMNLSEWQSKGGGTGSIAGVDPNLTFTLLPSSQDSPVVDSGILQSSEYIIDKAGTSRPQGISWDMGAYEFTGDFDTLKPMPPLNLMPLN